MGPEFFHRALRAIAILAAGFAANPGVAEPSHGIAMYGDPALPPDFVSLPYANPDAPKGGRLVSGNVGSFDSLNPFVQKGEPPWQLRYLTHESLMGRSYDEPFSLYGLLAESVETGPDRDWVEFTLREEAAFSDGTPVTVDDVIWSYETIGTEGHGRYRGFWQKVEKIEATGPRSVRLTFNTEDRELALIAGLRPILKKAQWEGKDFSEAALADVPIGSSPYVVENYEVGRHVTLRRNPDYWGKDLAFRRGTNNFDEIRIEFYGDDAVLKEAFKAQAISYVRELNAEKWASQYNFPAVQSGAVTLSEIPQGTPSGMTGFVFNTRRAPLDDWRVREALILAFNFEYINDTLTGGRQPRITSYFSGSELGMRDGPASGRVRELLEPYADTLLPGALEGYTVPEGDGTKRNRGNIRKAMNLLNEAGWTVVDGELRNAEGAPLNLTVLLRQDGLLQQAATYMEIYAQALERLGIDLAIETTDPAQYNEREQNFDFDLTFFRRAFSLSPGNEQIYYWGAEYADIPGSRNVMGMKSPAAEAMIDTMLNATSREDFTAAVRALDRVLISGRYVIPIHEYAVGRIAHLSHLKYPADRLPVYGDGIWFLPEVWWSEANEK
ncbi:putative D,D-dipeptide-binding periplasmic protein DdpA precursor [Roseovarius sp. THAF27]|uniref:extracellular solute-binding protein n=1 Tax=Roseovarius sp. THAF27 TaxID=2587850 RepID=UPI0012688F84|nr:extracellular solute-binding protein [Roseovarius sp. THAF27]QFT80961.1 putative D,D-dipeptide-binding periplasmic protein DdpA precursor [Roseovarius sp. THAF27]